MNDRPMLEPQDIAALREVAERATPGPWGHGGRGVATAYFDKRSERLICLDTLESDQAFTDDPAAWLACLRQDAANGEHIATFDPPTVLALLSEVERGRAAVEALAEEWEAVAAVARKDITLSRAAHRLRAALLAAHVPSPLTEVQDDRERRGAL